MSRIAKVQCLRASSGCEILERSGYTAEQHKVRNFLNTSGDRALYCFLLSLHLESVTAAARGAGIGRSLPRGPKKSSLEVEVDST